jgi:hypothetical protein
MFRRDPVSPTVPRPRRVRADRGPLAGRAPAPPTPAPPSTRSSSWVAPPLHKQGGRRRGQVIHVDSFGNLITSLPRELLARRRRRGRADRGRGHGGPFPAVFGRTFSDVLSGALIAYIGSGGQLEIARRDGSAAAACGAARGTAVRVTVATPKTWRRDRGSGRPSAVWDM